MRDEANDAEGVLYAGSREKEGQGLEVNKTLGSLLHFCPTIQPVST